MLNFLVLTKTHDKWDFLYWYRFHCNLYPSARFVILDNESPVNLLGIVNSKDIVIPIQGFPDQHNLYNKVFNDMNLFKDGDFVSIIDDDEYLYFKDRNDPVDVSSLEEVLKKADKDVLLVPQILISTREVLNDRHDRQPLPCSHTYRRNDVGTTSKAIIRYRKGDIYDFTVNGVGGTRGHIPAINGNMEGYSFAWWKKEGSIEPEVITFHVPNPPFVAVDYSSNIRLYHFHVKSRKDWDIKIARGSCATRVPWYKERLEENVFFGGYDTEDLDMKELYERYA